MADNPVRPRFDALGEIFPTRRAIGNIGQVLAGDVKLLGQGFQSYLTITDKAFKICIHDLFLQKVSLKVKKNLTYSEIKKGDYK